MASVSSKSLIGSTMIVTQPSLDFRQREAVRELWNNEYPESLELEAPVDFDEYLEKLSETVHYLVKDDIGLVHGWGMTFQRDGATWFAMILDESIHGRGIGSELLRLMKSRHSELLGWAIDHDLALKSDGQYYRSPLRFYLKNAFSVQPAIRLETPLISAVRIGWKA